MKVSVICPVLNEGNNIGPLVDFFLKAEPAEKELIFIDGGSIDGTIDAINKVISAHSDIKLLFNKNKYVPYALNLAIPICSGRYIVRIDGHTHYAMDYFDSIIKAFEKTGADIVGGPTRTKYTTRTQEAVAYAISHPFGIGGSKVHDEHFEGYTDSVTFGAWKREVFEKTGLFDERLVRNQDDEFHYRANKNGLKVYQDPAIKLYYSPRGSFKSLFIQYFQYGLYKPLVLKKIGSQIKLRHLIPAAFVVYLVSLFFLPANVLFFSPLALYALLVCYASFFNTKHFSVRILVLVALPCIHLAYGAGFLTGITKIFSIDFGTHSSVI